MTAGATCPDGAGRRCSWPGEREAHSGVLRPPAGLILPDTHGMERVARNSGGGSHGTLFGRL